MFPVEFRLLRGDLIETYKLLNGIDKVDTGTFFHMRNQERMRGHHYLALEKPSCNLDVRKFSFSHRIVNEWNALPQSVVESVSLEVFKRRLDKHFLGRLDEYFS